MPSPSEDTATDVGTIASSRSAAGDKRRSRTGCRTCRNRKVKCDERPGRCRNCERLNLSCAEDPEVDIDSTQAGLRRIRTFRSCRSCRDAKVKCSGEMEGCRRCVSKGVECQFDGHQVPRWKKMSQNNDAPTSSTGSGTQPVAPKRDPYEENSQSAHLPSGENAWLYAPKLPERENLLLLVEEYFRHLHHLRCFGFIHKPSFMLELGKTTSEAADNNALILIVCAWGARFFAHSRGLSTRAGIKWAQRARELALVNATNVSVENTMAVVLIHEHEIQVGNYASAFMLTGTAVRMSQALQINLEYTFNIMNERTKLSPSARESRRRLMWAIFVMDAWVGSGVDELTLVNEKNTKIQLPCDERSFAFEVPCIIQTLEPGTYLSFIPEASRAGVTNETLDLQATFVRLISLRKRVLKFVKHLDKTESPWLENSEFALLQRDLAHWYASLHMSLQFTQTAIYMRKEASQLGGLLFLHITYHQTMCDLNRISLATLFKIRCPIEFPPEQADFLSKIQGDCFSHAIAVSSVYNEWLRHESDILSDTWLPVVAHDSLKLVVYYLQHGTDVLFRELSVETISASLLTNLRALKKMATLHSLATPLLVSAVNILKTVNFIVPPDIEPPRNKNQNEQEKIETPDEPESNTNPPYYTPEFVLNPLAIYRMARKDISDSEKHAPENRFNTSQQAIPVPRMDYQYPFLNAAEEPLDDSEDMIWSQLIPALHQMPASFDTLQTYVSLANNDFATHGADYFAADSLLNLQSTERYYPQA